MKITKKWLKHHNACESGIEWYEQQNETDIIKLFDLAMAAKRYDYVNWCITEKMTKRQCVQYAIFAGELRLPIFEKEYPDDKHPRNAVEAAKKWLRNPSKKNALAAAYADAAAHAVDDAAYAAYTAAAAHASRAAYAADYKTKEKILRYGLELLYGETK